MLGVKLECQALSLLQQFASPRISNFMSNYHFIGSVCSVCGKRLVTEVFFLPNFMLDLDASKRKQNVIRE